MALFRIGQRIVDTTENARGTVKYLGEFSKFVINVHLQETSKVYLYLISIDISFHYNSIFPIFRDMFQKEKENCYFLLLLLYQILFDTSENARGTVKFLSKYRQLLFF